MSKKQESSLLVAARALSEHMSQFEALSLELARASINSEKSLLRACQGLEACSAHEAKLAESLRAFALAMQEVQLAQQRCMQQTAEAAERIGKRQSERAELQQRMVSLGQQARELTAPMAEPADASAMLGPLAQMERGLEQLIAEVSEVNEQAQQQDWLDLARDTQSLHQQLLSLKNRVLLSKKKLAPGAAS